LRFYLNLQAEARVISNSYTLGPLWQYALHDLEMDLNNSTCLLNR